MTVVGITGGESQEGKKSRNIELVQSIGVGNGLDVGGAVSGGGITVRYTQGSGVSAGEVVN